MAQHREYLEMKARISLAHRFLNDGKNRTLNLNWGLSEMVDAYDLLAAADVIIRRALCTIDDSEKFFLAEEDDADYSVLDGIDPFTPKA